MSVQDARAVRPGRQSAWQLSWRFASQAAERPTRVAAPRATGSPAIDRAWFGGLGVVLAGLAGEIRRRHQRAPDTGDLLAQLRAQERKLREQTEARTAIGARALQTIRSQLGLSLAADNPPQPPQAS